MDATLGGPKRIKVLRDRVSKIGGRATRIMSLPVGAYKRARLVGGLLIAGGMYGAELTSVPGHLKKKVRTAVARAISGKAQNSRRCLAGVILAVPGRPLEPDVAVPADVVHGWAKRMFFTPNAVQNLEEVWKQEVTRVDGKGQADQGRGKHARGPVAVVVATLHELGWAEDGPYTWTVDGRIYDLRKDSPKLIEQMAIQHATANVWEKAAKNRRDLEGLTGTVDWTVPRKMMRGLEKSSPGRAGTLRNILAGGTWPQTRVAEVEPDTTLVCPLCGDPKEDEYHRWYVCGRHNECRTPHEHIRTQAQNELNRIDEATEEPSPLRQHLWLRGLPQAVDVDRAWDLDESPTDEINTAVKVYTDGGAAHQADHRLRRSGWGIWVQDGHPLNSQGVVPGPEQTAGRAELYALLRSSREPPATST